MAISINQLKNGLTVLINDSACQVIDLQHVKPGKGAAFVRARLKNLKNGLILERTFRGDEKIEEAYVEQKKLIYLYHQDKIYHFMCQDSYEEIRVNQETLGDNVNFLKDNLEIVALTYNGEIIAINLPNFINFEVVYCEPAVRGDTVKAGTKSAKIDSGATIQVPLFVQTGDKIKVDTRTKSYVERVNN